MILINRDNDFGISINKESFESLKKSIEDSKGNNEKTEINDLCIKTNNAPEISDINKKLFNNDEKSVIKENENLYKVKKNNNQMKEIPYIQKKKIYVLVVILILTIMMNIATMMKIQTQNHQIENLKKEIEIINQKMMQIENQKSTMRTEIMTELKNHIQPINLKQIELKKVEQSE